MSEKRLLGLAPRCTTGCGDGLNQNNILTTRICVITKRREKKVKNSKGELDIHHLFGGAGEEKGETINQEAISNRNYTAKEGEK